MHNKVLFHYKNNNPNNSHWAHCLKQWGTKELLFKQKRVWKQPSASFGLGLEEQKAKRRAYVLDVFHFCITSCFIYILDKIRSLCQTFLFYEIIVETQSNIKTKQQKINKPPQKTYFVWRAAIILAVVRHSFESVYFIFFILWACCHVKPYTWGVSVPLWGWGSTCLPCPECMFKYSTAECRKNRLYFPVDLSSFLSCSRSTNMFKMFCQCGSF